MRRIVYESPKGERVCLTCPEGATPLDVLLAAWGLEQCHWKLVEDVIEDPGHSCALMVIDEVDDDS